MSAPSFGGSGRTPVAGKQGVCPERKELVPVLARADAARVGRRMGAPGTKWGSGVPGEQNFRVPGTKWGRNVPGRVGGRGCGRDGVWMRGESDAAGMWRGCGGGCVQGHARAIAGVHKCAGGGLSAGKWGGLEYNERKYAYICFPSGNSKQERRTERELSKTV